MQVNMHEAKTQLSQLAERALNGETIIIAKAGKPIVQLIPHTENRKQRVSGAFKGKIQISSDFNDADSDIQSMFDGK
jgi:prevent-host-death family protein